MINFSKARVQRLVIHHIGKSSDGEDIVFADKEMMLSPEEETILLKFFLASFEEPQFFNFSFTDGDFIMNPLFNYIGNIFDDESSFYEHSVKISRLLYEKSSHPFVKAGDLYFVFLADLLVGDEMCDGVLMLKAEQQDTFIKVSREGRETSLILDEGVLAKKPDKACLVLDIDREIGFKIMNIDHSNRQVEAKYWRDDFLYLSPMSDAYFSTSEVIKLTAEFVKKRLPAETPIDKKDQGAILKKSEKYLKDVEQFEIEDFTAKVFGDEQSASHAFQEFLDEKGERGARVKESFAVSEYAVKKHQKVFKSVIKLDKNFHIYVHGNHSKIVKGVLDDGQKYYMLYYEEEL